MGISHLIPSMFLLIFASIIPIIMVVLIIIFVASHKRIAQAQENMAKAQIEISKQLASLSIDLRHISNRK